MKKQLKWMSVLALAVMVPTATVWAQGKATLTPTGRLTNRAGATFEGTFKYSPARGIYVVSQKRPNGQTIDMEVKKDDVDLLQIDQPANLQGLINRVKAGQPAAAINDLQAIIRDYNNLQWDVPATRWLAEGYLATNRAADAIKACETLIKSRPEAAYLGEVAVIYWRALLKEGKTARLDEYLEKAIGSGDREAGAYALILRGDKIMEKGVSAENARAALKDGYLRVLMLYRGEATQSVIPQALYKGAKAFDMLQMGSRANDLRTELKRDYATSEWATRN